eukprot:CAMPEP_0119571572 /NCGR_PEP_ID=MMETSP1352-20130426/44189_1 /TAXON_ID=265584 /ORGANISM="Stauroneis constricta, Strain CCMP1120" /LENGTH=105 /DNA_ID=CAMNT_0007621255 /DNA_START=790 /DNA_END=1107 /DNA_ORIENTATION=+
MVIATSARKETGSKPMDLASCQNIAATLKDLSELPSQCKLYPAVVNKVKQNKEDQAMAVAFAGMQPGAAVQARRSRVTGYESPAKIKRRLTSSGTHHHVHPQKSG